jgi:hypothetical protein
VIILLVSSIGVYVTMFYQPKKIKQFDKETKDIVAKLQDNTEQMNEIERSQAKLRETLHRWNNRVKEISSSDVSSQTYGYLSDIIDESGAQQLKMNLSLIGSKTQGSIGYNSYKITGTSVFPNVFRFIWLLENGRKLYKINNLSLHSEEIAVDSTDQPQISMTYEMDIYAYFTTEATLGMPVMRPDSTPQPIMSNPFQPSILRQTPGNVRKLVDVNKISLKATANGKALVMNEDGKLLTLQVGDEVYLGKVTNIIPKDGVVEFVLNDGGIVVTRRLQIQFENTEKDEVQ